MFQGYWKRPDHTVGAFRNLWFHTGDGGRLDDDGFLTFTDRIKDSIRRRGENISSFEDEVMVAVVAREGHAIDAGDVFRYAVAEMPRFAVPRYLRVVAELPKTPSQRIQKFKLRDEGVTDDTFDRVAMGIEVPRS